MRKVGPLRVVHRGCRNLRDESFQSERRLHHRHRSSEFCHPVFSRTCQTSSRKTPRKVPCSAIAARKEATTKTRSVSDTKSGPRNRMLLIRYPRRRAILCADDTLAVGSCQKHEMARETTGSFFGFRVNTAHEDGIAGSEKERQRQV